MVTDRKSGYYDEQREMMDKTARMEFERDTLRIAMEYAYGKSSAMRKKLEDAGVDPKSVRERKDLEGIPLTKKAELRKIQEQDLPFGGLTGCDVHDLKRIYVSPGPTYDPEGRIESHYRWEKAFYAAGFRRGDVVQNTFSYHMSPAGFMFDEKHGDAGTGHERASRNRLCRHALFPHDNSHESQGNGN
jgi:phenylacetate-CoA ligase